MWMVQNFPVSKRFFFKTALENIKMGVRSKCPQNIINFGEEARNECVLCSILNERKKSAATIKPDFFFL